MVKTLPSNTRSACSIPGQGAKSRMPHGQSPQTKNRSHLVHWEDPEGSGGEGGGRGDRDGEHM